jgi:hypothetical protein
MYFLSRLVLIYKQQSLPTSAKNQDFSIAPLSICPPFIKPPVHRDLHLFQKKLSCRVQARIVLLMGELLGSYKSRFFGDFEEKIFTVAIKIFVEEVIR